MFQIEGRSIKNKHWIILTIIFDIAWGIFSLCLHVNWSLLSFALRYLQVTDFRNLNNSFPRNVFKYFSQNRKRTSKSHFSQTFVTPSMYFKVISSNYIVSTKSLRNRAKQGTARIKFNSRTATIESRWTKKTRRTKAICVIHLRG